MIFLARNLPIQIAGDPTEKFEVSNYKNLERVDTNLIRGGMCLIFSEGLAQKAAKGFRLLNRAKSKGFNSTGFDFLEEYLKLHEQRDKGKKDDSPTYINDLVAGRPVFGHPSKSGGFRFRYGRGRVSGFSAVSMHPATMGITDSFIAIGTQLKIEKPTKGCVVTTCDSVDGPIVKLSNGSVKKINSKEEAKKIYSDVEEIIYLGDILFPFSDLSNRNQMLVKPGYVEEWWKLELEFKNSDAAKGIDFHNVSIEKAVEISREHKIPLYPKYIFYWTEISREQFFNLMEWLKYSRVVGKIIFPYTKEDREKFSRGKRALELLGIEHDVVIENVVLKEEESKALLLNLGIDWNSIKSEDEFVLKDIVSKLISKSDLFETSDNKEIGDKKNDGEIILSIINKLSEFEIKDKAGDFIGARMGRPEKAKLRKLVGSPNILFPVGSEGGRLRSINAAYEIGRIRSSFPNFFCEKCNSETIFSICENCESKCIKMYYCYSCNDKKLKPCDKHENSKTYSSKIINIKDYFDKTIKKLGLLRTEIPALIKGVRGTSSSEHSIEHLAKGILRATYNLQVNKDGTIRYDATELPLVSFKPKEIHVGVEKLREMGYEKDIYGEELRDKEQILELKPHDIVIPDSPDSADEKAGEVFMKIGKFTDELLKKFYGLKSFYNF